MSAPEGKAGARASQQTGSESLSLAAQASLDNPGRLATAYDVQKAVGKGGYAIVYKGIRREDGRVVAVKKVEIFEMTQKKRERCLQEVTLLQQLSHPYIIQMLDAFIDENMLIIIFEWAPAGDLKRLIKKTSEAGKTLDEPSIWTFFAQITDALRYMHQHRIMHRDIKPANVLVGANGALKIGDLGLGRQLSEQTMEAFSKVGTPYYVSPEVVRGAGYDWKSDVWSLGCLLYELACLHSPFEMEGANLYDVFQKISKGDYPPLPADTFSAPLRSLVVRMLNVDPVKRPELEEVWAITQGIVQAQQAKSGRSDVHSVSEEVHSQLLMLEADVMHKLGRQNGKRVELPVPPADVLRQLHPLFFAEPLVTASAANSDAEQKRQLGSFMAVFAWLLQLVGKPDLAQQVEGLLEEVPAPRGTSRGSARGPQPPTMKRSSSGNAAQRVRVSRWGATAEKEGTAAPGSPARGAQASTVPSPPLPAGPHVVPSCTNLLKGAEAVKKAAQAVGLSTEFAPVNAVATGHGRAVCAMLQDMLDAAWSKLQPSARKPRYHAEPEPQEPEDESNQDAGGFDGDDDAVIDASLPLPGTRGSEFEEEEAEAYFRDDRTLAVRAADHVSQHVSSSGRGSGVGDGAAGRGSGPGRPTEVQHVQQQVDPAVWRAEAERLAPLLSRITMPAGASGAEAWGDWHKRVQDLKGSAAQLKASAPDIAAALTKTQTGVAGDLERIAVSEKRLNTNAEALMQEYRAGKARLADMQRQVMQQEELQQVGNAAMAELNSRLDEVGLEMQDRAGTLDGGVKIQAIQAAIQRLRQEMLRMDLKLGVVQQQLLAKQRRHMAESKHAGNELSDED